jgi:hypothetical protein
MIRLAISWRCFLKKKDKRLWNSFSAAGHEMAAMVLEVETADPDSEGPADQLGNDPLLHQNLQMQINE